MLKIVNGRVARAAVVTALLSLGVLKAQQPGAAALPPVPVPILDGKTVFLSNAGLDPMALMACERAGDRDQPYHLFYAALKSWGRYELVAAPALADLVLEIRFSAPLISGGMEAPCLEVTVLDGKTHFRLWTLAEPVQGALLKGTWNKNMDQGIANLLDDLKALTTKPGADPASK